eukprot:comp42207_c0_seq1/m.47455 comp42207_c0_seq1/g.47455  ORF comp42207_c0_seq1/g.47455 comp42207_c0_seq1/m.47455 type:complete len:162 (-) comp42207_c0_seq1:411-896(-)
MSTAKTEMPLERDYAYGVVPFCVEDKHAFYLLVKHHAGHWGFPKGHAEAGETNIACALREFEEETGIAGTEVNLHENIIFSSRYVCEKYRKRWGETRRLDKSVVLYLGRLAGKVAARRQEKEISELGWFEHKTAKGLLTHADDKRILDEAEEAVQKLQSEA